MHLHHVAFAADTRPALLRNLVRTSLAAAMLATAAHAQTPSGYWSFDNAASRLATTSGGGTMNAAGTYSYVSGGPAGTADSAIRINSGDANNLRCFHNMAANGGGSSVNVYTLMWDVKYPNNNSYKCLLQTNGGNSNDGDLFINMSGQSGSSSHLGGYGGSTAANTWYRIVLVVNTSSGAGDNDGKVFVNGANVLNKYDISKDATITLNPSGGSFGIHHDNNNENDTFELSGFACWNRALSNSEVAALGGPGTALVKNSQTITFNALANKTYGDAAFGLSASASSGLGVTFSVVSGPATWNGSTLTLTGAGAVTVRASQAGDANWNTATSVDQSFTVNKATQSAVSWSTIPTQTYGSGTVNLASYVSGGSGTGGWVFGVVSGPATVNGSTATITGAGSMVFSAYRASDANYNQSGTANSGSVTVNQKALTVSTPAVTTMTYDGGTAATITGSLSGIVGGDIVTLTGTGSFNTKDAGAGKAVTSTSTLGGAQAGNYSLTQPTGLTGTITAKGVMIAGVTAADKVYDGTTAAVLGGGAVAGAVDGDDVTATAGTGAFTGASIGTHAVTASGYGLVGTAAGNYALTAQPAVPNASIAAKALTVAADAKAKTYGDLDPALTYVATGLVGGDTLAGALTRVAGENVGNYAIGSGTLDAGANYTLAFTGTDLAIGKATLVCRAAGATRTQGQPDAAFAILYTGFVNGEDAEVLDEVPTASTITTTASPAGTYPITVQGGSDGNYAYQYEDGTLTVTAQDGTLILIF